MAYTPEMIETICVTAYEADRAFRATLGDFNADHWANASAYTRSAFKAAVEGFLAEPNKSPIADFSGVPTEIEHASCSLIKYITLAFMNTMTNSTYYGAGLSLMTPAQPCGMFHVIDGERASETFQRLLVEYPDDRSFASGVFESFYGTEIPNPFIVGIEPLLKWEQTNMGESVSPSPTNFEGTDTTKLTTGETVRTPSEGVTGPSTLEDATNAAGEPVNAAEGADSTKPADNSEAQQTSTSSDVNEGVSLSTLTPSVVPSAISPGVNSSSLATSAESDSLGESSTPGLTPENLEASSKASDLSTPVDGTPSDSTQNTKDESSPITGNSETADLSKANALDAENVAPQPTPSTQNATGAEPDGPGESSPRLGSTKEAGVSDAGSSSLTDASATSEAGERTRRSRRLK